MLAISAVTTAQTAGVGYYPQATGYDCGGNDLVSGTGYSTPQACAQFCSGVSGAVGFGIDLYPEDNCWCKSQIVLNAIAYDKQCYLFTAWTNLGCFWPKEGAGEYTCGSAPGVNTAETGYCIFGSETDARTQCEADPLCYGYAAGANGGNYQLTATLPELNMNQGACSFFVKPMAALPTNQPTAMKIGILYTSVTASTGVPYFNAQSVGLLEDQDLDDYWNPKFYYAPYTPDNGQEYDVTFSFASPQSLYYVEFYPVTDVTHTPTGYYIYTDSSMSTLLASNTAPSPSSSLITLYLTVPTVLSSVYVQIYKSTMYQIWLYEVKFYVLGLSTNPTIKPVEPTSLSTTNPTAMPSVEPTRIYDG